MKNTCTCWYEKLDKSTATFDKPPAPSKCADITEVPAATFDPTKPHHKKDEIVGGERMQKRDAVEGIGMERKGLGKLEELVRRHPARRYMGRGVLDEKFRLEFGEQ